MARDTSTGKVFEQTVLPALEHANYRYRKQVYIGRKPNGRKHIVDLVIYKGDRSKILVSKKWQQANGTAEEKIPFEVIMLARACKQYGYQSAYLVLGGTEDNHRLGTTGWTLREWYLSGELSRWITDENLVKIVGFENFLACINRHNI
ncbi:PD-(D/E)XK nuclease superfamily protein [[Limnothrix rosea] IAM M-220]|uniref:PD-(D/E)XK nuclease superfamily protein n=1 Tax=[Limnothrix rosea] IAM M-220 TaxID=454133 RepID=UPI0009671A9B|nr:PD-(D/E)XK nuclease superfamily protein [[Limnothrix rosea] IAM M-220]OKH11066.1 hypothetical protein NIES208_17825 [[Limnothrix rosea] IAM M-220]